MREDEHGVVDSVFVGRTGPWTQAGRTKRSIGSHHQHTAYEPKSGERWFSRYTPDSTERGVHAATEAESAADSIRCLQALMKERRL